MKRTLLREKSLSEKRSKRGNRSSSLWNDIPQTKFLKNFYKKEMNFLIKFRWSTIFKTGLSISLASMFTNPECSRLAPLFACPPRPQLESKLRKRTPISPLPYPWHTHNEDGWSKYCKSWRHKGQRQCGLVGHCGGPGGHCGSSGLNWGAPHTHRGPLWVDRGLHEQCLLGRDKSGAVEKMGAEFKDKGSGRGGGIRTCDISPSPPQSTWASTMGELQSRCWRTPSGSAGEPPREEHFGVRALLEDRGTRHSLQPCNPMG